MPDASGAVDLGGNARSPEEEEALRALQNGEQPEGEPEEESQAQKVLHTFLVVVDVNGNPRPIPVEHPQFEALVESTPDLMYGAAAVLAKDFAAVEAAQATAGIMHQQAMAMQQQMQDQMLQQRIAQGGGLRR